SEAVPGEAAAVAGSHQSNIQLAIPLANERKLLGVLTVEACGDLPFDRRDQNLLTYLGQYAALLYERLRQSLATRMTAAGPNAQAGRSPGTGKPDNLTGLLRSVFELHGFDAGIIYRRDLQCGRLVSTVGFRDTARLPDSASARSWD